MPFIP